MLEREAKKTKTNEKRKSRNGRRCIRSGKNDRSYSDLSVEWRERENKKKSQENTKAATAVAA